MIRLQKEQLPGQTHAWEGSLGQRDSWGAGSTTGRVQGTWLALRDCCHLEWHH